MRWFVVLTARLGSRSLTLVTKRTAYEALNSHGGAVSKNRPSARHKLAVVL